MTHDPQYADSWPVANKATTHDPLCYMAEGKWDGGCQCALIARVRADEKAKWTHVCPDNNCCHGSPN